MKTQSKLLKEIDKKVIALNNYIVSDLESISVREIGKHKEYLTKLQEKYAFTAEYQSGYFGFERRKFAFKTIEVGIGPHNSRPLYLIDGDKIHAIGCVSGYDGTPQTVEGVDLSVVRNVFFEIADKIMKDTEIVNEILDASIGKKQDEKQTKIEAINNILSAL